MKRGHLVKRQPGVGVLSFAFPRTPYLPRWPLPSLRQKGGFVMTSLGGQEASEVMWLRLGRGMVMRLPGSAAIGPARWEGTGPQGLIQCPLAALSCGPGAGVC